MKTLLVSLVVGLLAFFTAATARGGDCYYMLVFAAQRSNVLGAPCHTFATFVRAVDDGGAPQIVEVRTISWLPRDPEGGKVYQLHPEPGRNLDLPASLRFSHDQHMQVSVWGPYQITCELYERVVAHQARLESGTVLYKALDAGHRRERVANCIHAVGDLSGETTRLRIASPGWGDSASYFVTLQLRPWIVCPNRTHEWVYCALGLSDFPIKREQLNTGNPTAGPLLNALQALRHTALGVGSR